MHLYPHHRQFSYGATVSRPKLRLDEADKPQAGRLGLMVPGVPGYIPLRDRGQLQWTKADGSVSPDWWEVGSDKEKAEEATEKSRQMESYGLAAREVGVDFVSPLSRWPIQYALDAG